MDISELQSLRVKDLTKMAQDLEVTEYNGLRKQDLILKILESQAKKEGNVYSRGVLEIMPDGYGFLRSPDFNYLPGPDDIYVSPSQIKRFGLRTGHLVSGQIRPPKDSERFFALLRVDAVSGISPDEVKRSPHFVDLTILAATPERRGRRRPNRGTDGPGQVAMARSRRSRRCGLSRGDGRAWASSATPGRITGHAWRTGS